MNRKYLMLALITIASCSNLKLGHFRQVSIPDSSYVVSIPKDWTDGIMYSEINSLSVNLQRGSHGGVPGYPQFEFKYANFEADDIEFNNLKKVIDQKPKKMIQIKIKSYDAFRFDSSSEIIYDFVNGDAASSTISNRTIFVILNKGYLKCDLSGNKEHIDKYKENLLRICSSFSSKESL